jgi:hypothetical protein
LGTQDSGYEQETEIRLRPPRTPEAEAREWPLQLVARSRSRPGAAGRAAATLAIEPFRQLRCELRPERASAEESARYGLTVTNDGNDRADVSLRADDPAQALGFELRPPAVSLGAGEAVSVDLVARARERAADADREHRFTVTADAAGAVAQVPGALVQRRRAPSRVRRRGWQLSIRLLLTLIAAALLIGGSFATWTEENSIAQRAVCTDGTPDACLDYADFVNVVDGSDVVADAPDDLPSGLYFVGSAGFVTIVLGVLALAGARRGRSTWFAGVLAVLFLLVIAIQADARPGIAIPFLGAVAAIVAGFLPVLDRSE